MCVYIYVCMYVCECECVSVQSSHKKMALSYLCWRSRRRKPPSLYALLAQMKVVVLVMAVAMGMDFAGVRLPSMLVDTAEV